MGKIIAAFGGGMKPPTKGHYQVVKQALDQFPEIDKFIIYVGPKERDHVSQTQAVLIWEIYKKHLPMKVEIEATKVPAIREVKNLGRIRGPKFRLNPMAELLADPLTLAIPCSLVLAPPFP